MNTEKKKVFSVRFWVQAAVIGGVYAALTVVLAPISYGPMQARVSEALTVLPYFTPAAVPGLFIGCLAANIISPYGVPDMIFGSLASLLSAFLSYKLRNRPWLVPLPPVLVNGIIIGAMLYFVYGVEPSLVID
ncbi:MAG: QueT transporter family protein, partial [Clostridiales Family XIII bacterium]|nr:QueT transporter family protein [Clostridiales Family XIII bacterium]